MPSNDRHGGRVQIERAVKRHSGSDDEEPDHPQDEEATGEGGRGQAEQRDPMPVEVGRLT